MTYLDQPAFQRLQSIISERTNRIVLWIGAGFSMPAGLPSWPKLRSMLCDALDNKARSMDETEKAYLEQRATQIRAMQDNWLSFQMLESALGRTSYRSAIRDALSAAESCSIPPIYSFALDLPVTGILTLNLDRIATRAFTSKNPGRQLIEFDGSESGKHSHVLKSPSPFIVNLHGVLQNEESWVFTRDELRTLLRNEGYKAFVRSCLLTRTVVFMGISADDVAAGGASRGPHG